MKPLLDYADAKYLKRLVRELNKVNMSDMAGYYAPIATMVVRCNRARFKDGMIQCHSLSCSPEWFTPSRNEFTDPYGRNITASRVQ